MNKKVLLMVQTALFTSLIFVFTRFISVPVVSGYVHFGDALIYICALIIGGPYAVFAAAFGQALADISYGFVNYAIATLFVKSIIAIIFAFAGRNSKKLLTKTSLLLTIPAGVIQIGGYFLADLLIDRAYAFVDIAGNVIQAAGSAVVFAVFAFALDRLNAKEKFFNIKD